MAFFYDALWKKIEERNGHAKYVEKIVELSTFKKKRPGRKICFDSRDINF